MWRWRLARQAFIWAANLFRRKKRWSGCGRGTRRRIFWWACLVMKRARPSLRKKPGQVTFFLGRCTRHLPRKILGRRREFTNLRKYAKPFVFQSWRLAELRKKMQASVFAPARRESRQFGCSSKRGTRRHWRLRLRICALSKTEARQDAELFRPSSKDLRT